MLKAFTPIFCAVLVGCIVFGLVYLLGAFVQASFDIAEWSENARRGAAFFGSFLGAVTGGYTSVEVERAIR